MQPSDSSQLPLVGQELSKTFVEGESSLTVLRSVSLAVQVGETVAIIGSSGSGKTTLLQLLGGLDTPTDGQVHIFGESLTSASQVRRGEIRNESLGFVYQFHHLLAEFTALENVAMPLLLRDDSIGDVRKRAGALLARVGLEQRLEHKPGELSGGERQRVAVARALVTEPAVVLADEPTGNLDGRSGDQVLELMLELNREAGASIVLVTHDLGIARRMGRVLELREGQLFDVTD